MSRHCRTNMTEQPEEGNHLLCRLLREVEAVAERMEQIKREAFPGLAPRTFQALAEQASSTGRSNAAVGLLGVHETTRASSAQAFPSTSSWTPYGTGALAAAAALEGPATLRERAPSGPELPPSRFWPPSPQPPGARPLFAPGDAPRPEHGSGRTSVGRVASVLNTIWDECEAKYSHVSCPVIPRPSVCAEQGTGLASVGRVGPVLEAIRDEHEAMSNHMSCPAAQPTVPEGCPGAAAKPATTSGPLPSVGSECHESNRCKPCLFFCTGRCHKAVACTYCHFHHDPEQLRRARPSKRTRIGLQRREQLVKTEAAAAAATAVAAAGWMDEVPSFHRVVL